MPLRIRALQILAIAVFGTVALLPGMASARFSAPETISQPAASRAEHPHIAVDSRGNALVVWSRGQFGNGEVQARFRSAKGVWGPVQTLSAPGESSAGPHVAFDARDNAIVAWSSFEVQEDSEYLGTARLRAAFRPAGGSFGSSQVVASEAGESGVGGYRVNDLAANEGTVLAWTRRRPGDEIPTLQVAAAPVGGSFGATTTMGLGDFAQAAIDRDGNAIVAWNRESGPDSFPVWYATKPANGEFGEPVFLWDGPGLALALDRAGTALIAGRDYDDRFGITSRPPGGDFGPVRHVPLPGWVEDLSFDDHGNAIFALLTDWPRGRVLTATLRADGTLTPTQTLSARGETWLPVLAAGKGAVIVWARAEILGPFSRGDWQIEAAIRPRQSKSRFGPAEAVSDPSTDNFEPDVALTRRGEAFVVWTRGEDPYDFYSSQPRTIQFSLGRP
jgi:hypothetical protein